MTEIALDETPAEEFSRLVIEYNEGNGSEREEAWNLIADFALEHCDAILRGLRSSPSHVAPANPAQVTELVDRFVESVLPPLSEREAAVANMAIGFAIAAIGAGSRLNMPTDPAWYAEKTKFEDGHEIGAGRLTATINPTAEEISEMERLQFEALPKWAQDEMTKLWAVIGAGGQAVAVKPLTWEEDHGIAGMGPYRLFKAETPLGRFVYGTDAEGSAYYHTASSGVMMVGDEAKAKQLAEAAWQKAALAEVDKFVDPSAISQPHPADERVVEALREARERLQFGFASDRAVNAAVIAKIDAALAAKESR